MMKMLKFAGLTAGLIVAAFAVFPVQGQTCSDSQIVAAIYAEIKNDRALASQVSHINVASVNQAVKFQGWANTKRDYDKVVSIGMSTSCVRLVNVNFFADAPPPEGDPSRSAGGCATGTKPCGDVCIPEGDACNLATSARLLRTILFEPVAAWPIVACGR